METPRLCSFRHSRLSYTRSGTGPRSLLLFHGFGQNHTAFAKYGEVLGNAFTLYAIDLYFHGSEWGNGDRPLEKKEWNEIFRHFLRENNIERFSLLGFSMGAKFALACAEAQPEKVDALFLLAPDGIRTNLWYAMATSTPPLRAFLRSFVNKPARFKVLLRIAAILRLATPRLLRFAESQMSSEAQRQRVYLA